MTISLDNYVAYHPGVDKPWRELGRAEAKAAYERLMAAKAERFTQLAALLHSGGLSLPSAERAADADLDALEGWFRTRVGGNGCDELPKEWYSVISDLALYLGDVMIGRAETLSWCFYTKRKTDRDYQESVITGFRGVPNPHYHVNPGFLLAIMAQNLNDGRWVADRKFVGWVTSSVLEAEEPAATE